MPTARSHSEYPLVPTLSLETRKQIEAKLKDVEGIEALSVVIDDFVRRHYDWLWFHIKEGIERPRSVSPLLLKLIDKAKATPQVIKMRAEVFKLIVEKRVSDEETRSRVIELPVQAEGKTL